MDTYRTDGQAIAERFTEDFMSVDLARQIDQCDDYDLAPLFSGLFSDAERQPVLEAGHGSGRWVGWFTRQGIEAAGVDWSQELCDRAAALIPDATFIQGDMRDLPFDDDHFGGIISLGAVEHDIDGPGKALREYARVLRPGGRAVITVPYLGPVSRVGRLLRRPSAMVKSLGPVRRRFGKPVGSRGRRDVARATRKGWAFDGWHAENGDFEFYQYVLDKPAMRVELERAGLRVEREFVEFHDEGILHSLPGAGRYDYEQARVDFTRFGQLAKRVLPVGVSGHMLCYVVSAPARSGAS